MAIRAGPPPTPRTDLNTSTPQDDLVGNLPGVRMADAEFEERDGSPAVMDGDLLENGASGEELQRLAIEHLLAVR